MFFDKPSFQTVVETSAFLRDCENTFTRTEVEEVITFLATRPDAGDLIAYTGGIRKLRWGALGKGKRSGARVVYYMHSQALPLYLLAVYSKGEKLDLTARDKRMMRDFIDNLLHTYSDAMRPYRSK